MTNKSDISKDESIVNPGIDSEHRLSQCDTWEKQKQFITNLFNLDKWYCYEKNENHFHFLIPLRLGDEYSTDHIGIDIEKDDDKFNSEIRFFIPTPEITKRIPPEYIITVFHFDALIWLLKTIVKEWKGD